MDVVLTPEREEMIRQHVASGRYADVSEVVEEALRLLDERDRREQLRIAIEVGLQEIARGEDTPWASDSWQQLMQEADEEERLGVPLSDEARI